ncbi:MAG TPA: hypothetical protein VKQ36_07860, partial [Ktedonobacterales bacterium]|nr:hypothetical protein [Ktedonobacterales bacterium]
DGMEKLVAQAQKTHYAEILADEGFRAIATAIRRATVLAQYHSARESARENRYPFEVRYALGQDLLRSAAYPDEFLARLSEFVQLYNAENARIDERVVKKSLPDTKGNRRASIKTEHINHITHLVDEYGSELICKMLVAYGYARDPGTPGAPTTGEVGENGAVGDENGDDGLQGIDEE